MVADLSIQPDVLARFCRKWKITELALFGSVLRDDFRPDGDVGVLVVFSPDSSWTLLDVIGAEEELSELLGRPVDVVEKQSVEQSENWIRRDRILSSAMVIYGG